MKTQLTDQDALHIDAGIQEKYGLVAQGPAGHFTYPTGQEGLEKLGYDMDVVNNLPPATVAAYCGVGNPFSLGSIEEGQSVLDIGCGAGIDLLIASQIVGSRGRVVGIDMVEAMLDRAQEHINLSAAHNACVQKGSAEELEFPDKTFDVVISNGVFNLVLDKTKALSEVLRVLKPGGRLMIADQVMIGTQVKDIKTRVATWFQWEGGALPGKDFLELLNQAGFLEAELVTETGFNSSPKTKGVLFRARKPLAPAIKAQPTEKGRKDSRLNESETVSASKLSTLSAIADRAIEMGANMAKVIDTDSIVVEKWVKWKCVYGCPMYGKDGYHPPMTPEIDEVKEVIKEYAKAILLNGEDGKLLTEIACRLEGEAYHGGYYKAFALTALSAGTETVSEPGGTWPTGGNSAPCEPTDAKVKKINVRPMMEACGIDVFKTARRSGFEIDTDKETYGRWNFFAMVLIE